MKTYVFGHDERAHAFDQALGFVKDGLFAGGDADGRGRFAVGRQKLLHPRVVVFPTDEKVLLAEAHNALWHGFDQRC